jgi:HPt (histidine-containing phosphotransfer) domain-containing protein
MPTNKKQPAGPGDQPPPVDMERMLDLTGGEKDLLHELVDMYLLQTGQQLEKIAGAIRANLPDIVRQEAHSSGGASGTMGINRLARLLLDLENQGKSGTLTTAATLCTEAQAELLRVRDFLASALR